MKYKFHDEKVLHRIKPWVYLSTYILLLAFFLMHVQDVVNGFDFVLSLFRSLLYAIVFAYVLNLPMKKIESFIIRHTKETSLLRKRKRMVSMFLTFLIAFLLLIIIGSIILPSIIGSLISLMQNLSSFFTDIVKNIDEILKYFHIDYRIEVATPLLDPRLKQRVLDIIDILFSDTVKARYIDKELSNRYVPRGNRRKVRAQLAIYDYIKSLEQPE